MQVIESKKLLVINQILKLRIPTNHYDESCKLAVIELKL